MASDAPNSPTPVPEEGVLFTVKLPPSGVVTDISDVEIAAKKGHLVSFSLLSAQRPPGESCEMLRFRIQYKPEGATQKRAPADPHAPMHPMGGPSTVRPPHQQIPRDPVVVVPYRQAATHNPTRGYQQMYQSASGYPQQRQTYNFMGRYRQGQTYHDTGGYRQQAPINHPTGGHFTARRFQPRQYRFRERGPANSQPAAPPTTDHQPAQNDEPAVDNGPSEDTKPTQEEDAKPQESIRFAEDNDPAHDTSPTTDGKSEAEGKTPKIAILRRDVNPEVPAVNNRPRRAIDTKWDSLALVFKEEQERETDEEGKSRSDTMPTVGKLPPDATSASDVEPIQDEATKDDELAGVDKPALDEDVHIGLPPEPSSPTLGLQTTHSST